MFGLDKLIDILFGFISALFGSLFDPLADFFVPFTELIFGKDGEPLLYSTFTVDEFTKTIGSGMVLTQTLAGFFLFASFLIATMKLSSAGLNPSNRTALLEFFKDWFLVTIVIMNLPAVYDFILIVNSGIVDIFKGAINSTNDPFNFFADTIEELKNEEGNKSLLSWIALQLVQLGLSIWASFYYMMRKFTLIILMILGPIFVSLWMFPQFKGLTMNYFKEFIGTTLTQGIHAFLFWVITMISFSANGIETLLLMVIFIPISESVRSLLGAGANMTGAMNKAGAMFGMSALAGMYGSVKGALDGKGVFESIKGAGSKAYSNYKGGQGNGNEGADPSADDVKSTSSVANAGSTLGSTDRAERMLKAGEILSKGGKMIGGMAGTLVGTPMGPGGAIVGGTIGSIAGGAAGGLTGRFGYAVGSTLNRSLKDGWKHAKEGGPQDLADAIADEKTKEWASSSESQFKEDLKNRGFDAAQQEALWNAEKRNKFNEFKKEANADLAGINYKSNEAKVRDLRQKTAEDLTNHWKSQNEQAFKDQFKHDNPQATAGEIEQAWNKQVTKKAIENFELVNGAAKQTFKEMGRKGESFNDNTFISKDAFREKVFDEKQKQDKVNFANELRQKNPSITQEAIDKAYSENASNEAKLWNDQQLINSSVNSVKGGPLLAKGSINKEALSTQMAQNRTARQKEEFFNNAKQQAISAGVEFNSEHANEQWNQREEAIYQDNLKEANFLIGKQAGKQIIRREQGQIHGTGRLGKAELGLKAAGRFVSGTAQGLVTHSGAQDIINDFKDSRFGKFIDGAGAGYSIALQEVNKHNAEMVAVTAGDMMVQPFEKIGNKIAIPTVNAMKEGFTAFKNHRSENPIQRQANHRNRSAFAGGLIAGEKGYQNGALIANKLNPYKNAAQQQALEIKEIMNQVDTVYNPLHPSGREIADGALQLIVDQNQSYVQMKTRQGEVRKVSIVGAGDSSLQKGQVAYQNITVNDEGILQPKGQFYSLDSTGGKVALSHQPNVNPQRLVANRANLKVKPRPTSETVHLPFNSDVDAGKFNMSQIKAASNENTVTVVYEQDKTYLVQKDVSGKEYRISPYGPGEPSLKPGQRLYSKREIVGYKLAKTSNVANETYFYDEDGNRQITPMEPTFDPNKLIPQRPNKRYIARKEVEKNRRAVISGNSRVV